MAPLPPAIILGIKMQLKNILIFCRAYIWVEVGGRFLKSMFNISNGDMQSEEIKEDKDSNLRPIEMDRLGNAFSEIVIFKQNPRKTTIKCLSRFAIIWAFYSRKSEDNYKPEGWHSWCFLQTGRPERWSRMSKRDSGERQAIRAQQHRTLQGRVIFMFPLSGDEKSNWFMQGLALEKQD